MIRAGYEFVFKVENFLKTSLGWYTVSDGSYYPKLSIMEGKRKSVRIRQSLKDNFIIKMPKILESQLGKFSTSAPIEDFP